VGAVGVGFGLGFLVALQVGPMSLLLVRSTLRNGLAVGLAIGLGVATIDALYAAAGATGAAGIVQVHAVATAVGLIGAAVLLYLAVRMLHAVLYPREVDGPTLTETPRKAFGTAVGATASNPMTIVSWTAIFGAAWVATDANTVLLVVGVAFGSAAWMISLATAVSVVRRRVTRTFVRVVEAIAGIGMLAFAATLAYKTLS
jgi:putative LysE/RhtB family amino acid efflux pump